MKVILKFRTCFWKPETANIVGGAFATYWQPIGNQFSNDNILTAFAVGEHAEKLGIDGTRTIKLLLGELDNLFGNQAATKNFLDSHTINWSNEPFIGGYVTYPNSSSYFADKTALAKSVQNKLFFAGEATNTDDGSIGYVHGAIGTGAKAAQELIATVQ